MITKLLCTGENDAAKSIYIKHFLTCLWTVGFD